MHAEKMQIRTKRRIVYINRWYSSIINASETVFNQCTMLRFIRHFEVNCRISEEAGNIFQRGKYMIVIILMIIFNDHFY